MSRASLMKTNKTRIFPNNRNNRATIRQLPPVTIAVCHSSNKKSGSQIIENTLNIRLTAIQSKEILRILFLITHLPVALTYRNNMK